MSVPENIKKLRKNLNMTQKELAENTGLSIGTIQGYEQGRYAPKLDALRLLMETLCCSYSDIIEEPTEVDEDRALLYWLLYEEIPTEQYEKLLTYFNKLKDKGRTKAIEQVELLTKISEYCKDPQKYQKKDE